MTDRDESFEQLRRLLLSIAYRMLGSAAEADDIVQEAYLRWQKTTDDIRSSKSFLTTIVTRLCIDTQRAARVRREGYMGMWLPEPIATDVVSEHEEHTELTKSISIAFLVVLEALSPIERAVFVLHEVFDIDYDEIAEIVQKSRENCRQIARRAKEAVHSKRSRFVPSTEYRKRVVDEFETASRTGDVAKLTELFTEDVQLWADGGPDADKRFGRIRAITKPIVGRDHVLRFLRNIATSRPAEVTHRCVTINGEPALVTIMDGRVVAAVSLDIDDGRIRGIYILADDQKLRNVTLTN
jgi:RNA polymerase sigma-70 factor, ECF subfamily